jgi:hypothetical protein
MKKFLLIIILIFNLHADNLVKVGDYFFSYFWTMKDTTQSSGYYGLSVVSNQLDDTNLLMKFKVTDLQWWQSVVSNPNKKIKMTFSSSKPDSVEICSGKFSSALWIRSIWDSTGSKADSSLRFYFPIIPKSQSYNLYDYFSIKLNDTMNLQFQGIQDSVFMGSFIRRISGQPTYLYAKNAIAIVTTAANDLRIRSIQVNGKYEKLVSSYLKFHLSSLVDSAYYYGLDIVDTIIPIATKPTNLFCIYGNKIN